jgi:hypothetical protein
MKLNLRRNKKLKAEIEWYRQKLASAETVQLDETIGCHAAILILDDDTEQRIRSIETLAQSGAEIAVPAAVKELVQLSYRWPQHDVNGWPLLLLTILKQSRLGVEVM